MDKNVTEESKELRALMDTVFEDPRLCVSENLYKKTLLRANREENMIPFERPASKKKFAKIGIYSGLAAAVLCVLILPQALRGKSKSYGDKSAEPRPMANAIRAIASPSGGTYWTEEDKTAKDIQNSQESDTEANEKAKENDGMPEQKVVSDAPLLIYLTAPLKVWTNPQSVGNEQLCIRYPANSIYLNGAEADGTIAVLTNLAGDTVYYCRMSDLPKTE